MRVTRCLKGGKVAVKMRLKELKEKVQITSDNVLISKKSDLIEKKVDVIAKKMTEDGKGLCVYKNGYVLYAEDKHWTIFHLYECKNYYYEFVDESKKVIDNNYFENEEWYLLPMLIGMNRIEENYSRIVTNHKTISLDIENSDHMKIFDLSVPDVLEKLITEETIEQIKDVLSERQWYVLTAYYCEGLSQVEIAKKLNVRQAVICRMIKHAIRVLRCTLSQ